MRKGGYSSRKKWDTSDVKTGLCVEEQRPYQDEKYEEYLLLLQHKNRVIKKLSTKDDKQKDLERKEQGFTLYLNGANQNFAKQLGSTQTELLHKQKSPTKRAKTAREKEENRTKTRESQSNTDAARRTKTAPERNRRKSWLVQSHEIKTSRGVKVRAKAPEILTGNYEDDFEIGDSINTQTTYSEDFSSDVSSSSETDSDTEESIEESYEENMDKQRIHRSVKVKGLEKGDGDLSTEAKRYKVSKQKRKDGLEGQGGEQMMLSVKDVKKLRQSLEMNESIRQSIARHQKKRNSESDGGSPIPEVEEEIDSSSSSEDEILEEDDPHDSLEAPSSVTHNRKVQFRPKDVIVLEFGGLESKGQKSERQLSAARKGDPDSYGALKEERRPTPRDRPLSAKKAPPPRDSGSAQPQRIGTPAGRGGGGILANKKPTPIRGQAKSDVLMKPESNASKKSRPLSANKKKDAHALDTTIETRAVIEAMKKENEDLKRRQTPTPRHSRSAPGRQEPSPKLTAKPSTAGRRSSTDMRHSGDRELDKSIADLVNLDLKENVDKIVAKVLQLDSRGQRRLLKALAHIEEGLDGRESNARESRAATGNTSKPTDFGQNNPTQSRKPTQPTQETRKSNQNQQSRPETTTAQLPIRHSNEPIEIHVEILSNWGHETRVGLTEIQLFDMNRRKLDVREKDVMVRNIDDARGDVMCLFNGKFKTTKERNMLSCNWLEVEPVEFLIIVNNNSSSPEFGISKLKIWNYNRSLIDLNIGVRHMRITVDGQIVFEDEIEKGCGNQVFDYGKTIKLVDTSSSDSPREPKIPEPKPLKPSTPNKKPVSDVILPLELLNQPSEYSGLNLQSNRGVVRNGDSSSLESKASINPGGTKSDKSGKQPVSRPQDMDKSPAKPVENSKPSSSRDSERKTLTPIRISKPPESAEKPTDSLSTPRERYRKRKDRKSKMAAKLDGSSDIESSNSMSISNSIEQSQERTSFNNIPDTNEASINGYTPTSTGTKLNNKSKTQPENKQTMALKAEANTLVPPRPGSGLGGTSDDESMLQQLQKLTIKDIEKTENKSVPQWLTKDKNSANQQQNSSRSKKDDSLLGDWPKLSDRGVSHLKNFLDDTDEKKKSIVKSSTESRKSGSSINSRNNRNVSATQNPPVSVAKPEISMNIDIDNSEEFDLDKEVEVEISKMQQIESARAQWRKKEEDRLEESWNALTMFDRNQKTRLSFDLEHDIMDEYLNTGRTKPKVATIPEEQEVQDLTDEEFVIPELPKGRLMVVNIKTTWGDRHYVGLNGIEVFTNTGELAEIDSIRSEPRDINILPEYNKDPRVVDNLIDGINRTRDDTHMWLAPYTKGGDHKVFITMKKPVQVAMMRLWNYNKSRIHSYRGAKDLEISLDDTFIFKGEVARACGGIVGGSEAFGDTILFTMDEDMLELVAEHDQAFEADLLMELENEDFTEEDQERPNTADKGSDTRSSSRPFTAAANQPRIPQKSTHSTSHTDSSTLVLSGQCLKLNFTATWGDPHYLGLTGLEVVDKNGEALPVTLNMLHADPRDLHVLPGYERDDRTLDKLIDGSNVTRSDEHMWMIPFTEGEQHILQITFDKAVEMTGLRLWNYNKSSEDTYRGVKIVHVMLDDRAVSPSDGFLIRKGPGNCFFDYAQEISFTEPCTPRVVQPPVTTSQSLAMDDASQEYEVVQKPCGFIYQLQLLCTHGDQYYVGLNGLEFYDSLGDKITLTANHISAYPHSVNELPGVDNDVRTPDKLIDGHHDTQDGSHMWLAPVLPGVLNRIYVIFDEPMEISIIKIWNYSKTASRGVKDFALLVDDLLVYNGTLDIVTRRGILPHVDGPQLHHTILFTDDKDIRQKEKHTAVIQIAGDQDIQLLNDRKVMAQYGNPQKTTTKPVDQGLRPKTSVTRKFSKRS